MSAAESDDRYKPSSAASRLDLLTRRLGITHRLLATNPKLYGAALVRSVPVIV